MADLSIYDIPMTPFIETPVGEFFTRTTIQSFQNQYPTFWQKYGETIKWGGAIFGGLLVLSMIGKRR